MIILNGRISFESYKISKHLNDNINSVKSIFENEGTLVFRRVTSKYISAAIFYLDGMVDNNLVGLNVDKAILEFKGDLNSKSFLESLVYPGEIREIKNYDDIVSGILEGDTIVFAHSLDIALKINTKGYMRRSPQEPPSEAVVRGPREGFIENIITNTSLLRRKLQTSDLVFETSKIGNRSKTRIAITYLKSVVNDKVLKEVRKKVSEIEIDGVVDTNIISEIIRSGRLSPFKTVGTTERPDVAAARLLEGKVIIIIDGSPVALSLPYLFIENFQVNEDYYLNFYFGSFIRLLRFICFFLTVSVPAAYISFVNFHWSLLPPDLALNIQNAHKEVPLSTFSECIFMLAVFEVIRESGQRLTSGSGQAVSIVGALVVGQAAVEANIISAPMVIVIGVTAITGLVNTHINSAAIILRFFLIVFSSVFGFYGFLFAWIVISIHLLSLNSFGVRYMEDILSHEENGRRDSIMRFPWDKLYLRPSFIYKDRERADIGED